jgi:proline iminopeptidase
VLESGLLEVGNGHRVYWEESGTPDGIPGLYLHGGPGATLGPGGYRNAFDPLRCRIVGLDQRGCGRSQPSVLAPGYDLGQNTTAHLIEDIEHLREHLGIDRWLLNGVSWGSTLALAYAQSHPDRVTGIVLMAVTTTDRFYVDWICEAAGTIFPEAWDRLATHAEAAGIGYRRGERRVIEAYAALMTDPDPAVRDAASHAWAAWEDAHISLPAGRVVSDLRWEDEKYRHEFATLVTHYWAHDGFLDPPVLQRIDLLRDIPATLIHGRRDVSGPLLAAWELHRGWPASELIVIEDEGHGGPAMVRGWREANVRHADRISASQTARRAPPAAGDG